METLVVEPDTVIGIYQAALQMLAYIFAAAACLVAAGYAFYLARMWRDGSIEAGELGTSPQLAVAAGDRATRRRLHLIRSQV